ncbi:unnamed protein product [Fraxinus pennsylvanica]|uniref:Uncharacterized protein n=1 Tax=Fraxinus pennsylvanica TaxID=56036 RepID=A0AAD1ZVV1_9LAMI|nr:unnamed protein product [Fraxinus pennsylvanica]
MRRVQKADQITFRKTCEVEDENEDPRIFDKSKDSNQETNTIKIGIILDTKSWVGKVVHSCITIAISDFYMLNEQYKTRIALETRDSRGEPSDFIASESSNANHSIGCQHVPSLPRVASSQMSMDSRLRNLG